MDFSAAILAGGRSSRFGQDKARFMYKDKALLSWVSASLSNAAELFLIANQAYPEFKLPVYSDIIASQGPLSGIHAGLSYAKHDWLAVAACDMPFLTPAYWDALLDFVENKYQILSVAHEGKLEPLASLYHKSCLPFFENRLRQQRLGMQTLIRQMDVCIVPFETLELDPKTLANINYLSDLKNK